MAGIGWESRLREAVAAFNAGDYEVRDGGRRAAASGQHARGPGRRLRARCRAALLPSRLFDEQRLEAPEIKGEPPTLVGHMLFHARGAGSGLPVEIESWTVYRVEGELVRRMEIYQSREEAMAAAALG